MAIEYRPLDSLIPYVRNSRTHTPDQIEAIKRSLLRFGWTTPMIVAGSDMIAGHARLAAASRLAEEGADIPRNPDRLRGPVVDLSALNEAERRAYIIADNQLATLAGWDDGLLRLELESLKAEDLIDVLGFPSADLERLLKTVEAPEGFQAFDESIETEHACPRCGYAWSGTGKAGEPDAEPS